VSARLRKYLMIGVILLAVLTVGVMAGCGSSDTTTTSAAPETSTTAAATETTAGSLNGVSGIIDVKGAVESPMTLTAADLEELTVVDLTVEHPKLGTMDYTGVRFSELMPILKVQDSATVVQLGCTDGYIAEIPLADIESTPDAMLAIGDDGSLNAVMPGMFGKAWARDITAMTFQ
jgi:hypothetical protein